MSILAFARVTVDLMCTKQNIIKILKRGVELQCKYLRVGEFEEIQVAEAADLAIERMDPDWAGDLLTIKLPNPGWDFSLRFYPNTDGLTISFSGFEKNPLERTFRHKLEGIDFALYVDSLLKLVEPYQIIDIEVGYDY